MKWPARKRNWVTRSTLPAAGSGNKFILNDVDVAAGSDGTVYLLHGASCPLIYVISPDGDVVRKLRIDA